ncbi:MAG TPA: hypothetical protein VM537_36650 [Anaerolineae bacterium]|nr:hypothetical protein [Anaerolineae bacterium]
MAEKKLSVKLSAKDRLSKALSTAGGAARKTGSALKTMAKEGSAAVEGLTRKLFFLKEAINVVAQVARGLWDAFITPAINARKLAVSLTNVFGGETSQKIRQFSTRTGLDFEAVGKAALDMNTQLEEVMKNGKKTGEFKMGSKIDKAGGLDAYLKAIERVSKWRPDLGTEGAISFVNDLVNKVTEATEGSSKQLGQYTSVMIGGTAAQAVDLSAELDKLGVVARIADPATSALDRLRAAWAKFAAEVGGRVLEKLAEGALKLLDWLTKNEDKVLRLTDAFANLVNQGIQKLIDWVDSGGIDTLITKFGEWWQIIKDIWESLKPIVDVAGKVLGGIGAGMGGKDAADPWKSGEGGTAKSLGRTVGAAASPGGFSKAAENMRLIAATGAAGLGLGVQKTFGFTGAFKGKNLAKDWGEGVLGVPTGAERKASALGVSPGMGNQNVNVTVSVDDEGALKAYVAKEGQQRNREIFEGAGGGNNPQPSYGWR